MYRTTQTDYIDPRTTGIYYSLPKLGPHIKNQFYTYKYVDVPLFGIGPSGAPIINCDDYWDTSLLEGVSQEFCENIETAAHKLHYMTPFGLVPSNLNNSKCLDSYLLNIEKYDPGYTYSPFIQEIDHYHKLKNYMVARYNLNKPWRDVIHFKKLKSFFEKNDHAEWNEIADLFPRLKKLVTGLPFKTVGYVMIMRNNSAAKLDIHRDIFPRNHMCHHINIALDKMPRPVFMYDAHTKIRYYKDVDCVSYFFNECDLHGADAVFQERLTLRVDGVFADWFAEKIGLENNITFDWAYDKPQAFIRDNKVIPICQETDI